MYDNLRGVFAVLATSGLLACGSGSNDDDAKDAGTGESETDASATSGPTDSSGTSGTDTTSPGDGSETSAADTENGGANDVWELRAGGFSPPNAETWYSCYSFQVEAEELHHIIGFEAKVTSPFVHHYVLSLSDEPVDLDPASSCISWPSQILWAWAPGIEGQMLPEEAGFLVGDKAGGVVTFVLQVHYNNPLRESFTDDDGIDVIVTRDLRPNSAGILSQGDIATILVPPGEPSHVHTARCGAAQTQNLLNHDIHVFATFLHMHEIGAAITSEVFRDGSLMGQVGVDDPFDFNSQKFMPADIDISPGDEIVTDCTYDSTGRTGSTPGGVASEHEMCINFMMYYPKVTGEKCGAI